MVNDEDQGERARDIIHPPTTLTDSRPPAHFARSRKDEEFDLAVLKYAFDGLTSTTAHEMDSGDEFSLIFRPRSFLVKKIRRFYSEFFEVR